MVRTFAGSSRRVRAYALFIISRSVAVAATLGVAISLVASSVVTEFLGVEQAVVIQRVQAAVAGDTLPIVAAMSSGG